MKDLRKSILRKMGFINDSKGIVDRYINVAGAWDEHLDRTRSFILRAIEGKEIQNMVVLGSGWLLDFPLDEIVSKVKHIWLYDVVHPPQVIHRLKNYSNVTALTADITGGAILAAYNAAGDYRRTGNKADLQVFSNCLFSYSSPCDFVISLNILSQIGDLVVDYLKQHVPCSKEEADAITGILQQSHLNLLTKVRSCLITDVWEQGYDRKGNPGSTKNLIKCSLPEVSFGHLRHHNAETWEWEFDPLFEYNPGIRTVSKVVALEL